MLEKMYKMKNKKGFTLIELIVVIAVIAILAAILLPQFLGFSKSAKEKAVLSAARNYSVSAQALVAESPGTPAITAANVIAYTGKTFAGTLVINTATDGSFTYTDGGIRAVYLASPGSVTVTTVTP